MKTTKTMYTPIDNFTNKFLPVHACTHPQIGGVQIMMDSTGIPVVLTEYGRDAVIRSLLQYPSDYTTVRVRHLPRKYLITEFCEDLCSIMGSDTNLFDFVYFPVEKKVSTCRGYAFVNFRSHSDAYRFIKRTSGIGWCRYPSNRPAETDWALQQGFDQIYAHISAKPGSVYKPQFGVSLVIKQTDRL